MKKSRKKSKDYSTSASKEISLIRNQSVEKSFIKMNNSRVIFNSNIHSLTPETNPK
jgi:hypothetical protein